MIYVCPNVDTCVAVTGNFRVINSMDVDVMLNQILEIEKKYIIIGPQIAYQ